jgi:hypothetical protein
MVLTERTLRNIENKAVQQGLRYYIQHGPLDVFTTGVRTVITTVAESSAKRYLDTKSLSRDELLSRVSDDRIWYYGSPETIKIPPPFNHGPVPERFQQSVGPFDRTQPFVCEVPDVELVGPVANPKTNGGKYIRSAQGLSDNQLARSILTEKLSSVRSGVTNPDERIGVGVVFTNLWSENHFHWQLDFLPRLRGVEEYIRRTDNKPKLILGPEPPTWQKKYLELLGYGPDDWYEYNGKRLHVDTLVVPYAVRFKRSQLEWIRDRLTESVTTDPKEFPSNVYISRDDALCRRVLNEDELMDALDEEGFVRVELSKISVENQIRMFAQADTVVGPHGAGFANLMYADDASVIEFFGVKEGPSTFHTAGILGHQYGCVRCDSVGEDLVVDVGAVMELFGRMTG